MKTEKLRILNTDILKCIEEIEQDPNDANDWLDTIIATCHDIEKEANNLYDDEAFNKQYG